eukprot:241556_1
MVLIVFIYIPLITTCYSHFNCSTFCPSYCDVCDCDYPDHCYTCDSDHHVDINGDCVSPLPTTDLSSVPTKSPICSCVPYCINWNGCGSNCHCNDCHSPYELDTNGQCVTNPPTSVTSYPTAKPSASPSLYSTFNPSTLPTTYPSTSPSTLHTTYPSTLPTRTPTFNPSANPTKIPTQIPTVYPTNNPSNIHSTSPFHPKTAHRNTVSTYEIT